ncbi:MAG: TonB-dependent receptor [Sphingopyxis sp.]|nr:TonB-dependent receptor [Sphingopyxis sp.]
MRNKLSRIILSSGVALGALGTSGAAAAQDAGEPQSDSNAEIVVTAQKRTERLQDVPLSITAFSERAIEQQGITSIDDYATRSAGVRLSRDGTQATISMRGIASSTNAETTSATAGIYIDDYPIYDTWFRFTSPDLRIFDVERIEVLRGPQGTLYGATSLSGSVRIITNKPDLAAVGAKFEGTLSTTDGGGTNYALNTMINVPLSTDKLGLRVVGYYRSDSGYVDAPQRGGLKNVDDRETYGGRLYLSAQPTETLSLLASLSYQHDGQDDQSATYYSPPAGRTIDDYNSVLPAVTRSELLIASLVANQEIGDGNLTLSGTYAENSSRNRFDATPFTAALGLPIATYQFQPSDSDTKIFEARYTSAATGNFRYILGAYYNSRYRTLYQVTQQPALIPFFGTGNIYDVYAAQRATELAAFGEGTLAFADKWEATLGLRVFKNSYDFKSSVSGLFNSFVTPLTPSVTDIDNGQTDYTPRLSISYKPSAAINIYATASKGYRFGLTNYNSGANGGTPLAYKSDVLWNYEAGIKASLWGGRGTFNTTAYYIDWKDIQLSFRNANGQAYVTNAGDARSYGIESEFSFRPSPVFEMNAAFSLGESELTKDNPGILRRAASIRGPAVLGVFKGDDLPGSQSFSGSGGAQYNIRDIGSGDAYIRADVVYVGSSYVDFMKEGSLKIGDYTTVNLRVGYRTDRFEITAFADNLLNSRGIVNALPNADLVGFTDAAYRVRPRTIGATLRARY